MKKSSDRYKENVIYKNNRCKINLFLILFFFLSLFIFTSSSAMAQANLSTSTKTVNNTSVRTGDIVIYTISLINTGNAAASNVRVTDAISSPFGNLSVIQRPTGSTNNSTLTNLDISGINVPPGGTRTINFSVVATTAPGSFNNSADVYINYVSGNPVDFTLTAPGVNVINIPANLATSEKKLDRKAPRPGDEVNYTIFLSNTGDSNITINNVTDTILSGLTFAPSDLEVLDSDGNPLAGITDNSNATSVDIDNILVPSRDYVEIKFPVTVTAALGDEIINIANVDVDGGGTDFTLTAPALKVTESLAVLTVTKSVIVSDGSGGWVEDPAPNLPAGESFRYRILIEAAGGNAKNIRVLDEIPAGLNNFIAVSVPPGSINLSLQDPDPGDPNQPNGKIDIEGFSLNDGDSAELFFQLTIDSPYTLASNIIQNTVEVDADGISPVTDDAPDITVLDAPDLSTSTKKIKEVYDPTPPGITYQYVANIGNNPDLPLFVDFVTGRSVTGVSPGWEMEYEVTVVNTGNEDSTDTVLSDALPPEVSYISGTTELNGVSLSDFSGGFRFDPTNPASERYISSSYASPDPPLPDGILTPGKLNAAVLTYRVLVNSPSAVPLLNQFPGTAIDNSVNITNIEGTPETLSFRVLIESEADFTSSTKIASINPSDPNDVTYTINLVNTGTSNATGVTLYDDIPGNATYVPGSLNVSDPTYTDLSDFTTGPGHGFNERGFISLADIKVNRGSNVVITFRVTLDSGGPVYNVAGVNSTQGGSYSIETTGIPTGSPRFTNSTKVSRDVDGNLFASGNPPEVGNPLNPGETIVYTITVRNDGSVPATDVVVRDFIPAGTVYIYNSAEILYPASGDTITQPPNPSASPVITWDLGTMDPITVKVLKFKVRVEAGGFNPGDTVNNTATVEYTYVDPPNPPQSASQPITDTTPPVINQLPPVVGLPDPPVNFDPDVPKIAFPDPVPPGGRITYVINFGNYSGINDTDVVITDQIPANTTLDQNSIYMTVVNLADPREPRLENFDPDDLNNPTDPFTTGLNGEFVELNSGILQFKYPELKGSQTGFQVRFDVIVNGNPGTVTNSTYTIESVNYPGPKNGPPVTVNVSPDIPDFSASIKTANPSTPVLPGDSISYTVEIKNTGPVAAPANTVSFLDIIPANTVYAGNLNVSVANNITFASNQLSGQILAPIGPGASVFVSFDVLVDTSVSAGDLILNDATITDSTPDPDKVYVTNQTVNKVNLIVLDITKSQIPPGDVAAGGNITYSLDYTISGGTAAPDANSVVITDKIPLNTTFVDTNGTGGVYNSGTGIVTWTLGNLPPGTNGSVELEVRVSPSAVQNLEIINSNYRISALNALPATGSSVSTTVDPGADQGDPTPPVPGINVSKSAADALLGSSFSYTITVSNTNQYGYNLTIADVLPDGVTFASSSETPTVNIVNPDGTTDLVFLDIKDLAPGESYSLTVTVDMETNYNDGSPVRIGDLLKNTAVAYLDDDPFGFGNKYVGTASDSAEVLGMLLTKGGSVLEGLSATGVQDWPLGYTLTVTTPVALTDVVVTDTLPSNMEYLGNSSDPLDSGFPRKNIDGTITLQWTLASVPVGSTSITYNAGVAYLDRDPTVGDNRILNLDPVTNTASASAKSGGLTFRDDATSTLTAKYFTIVKSVDRSDVLSGDVVEFTLRFQISQYYPLSGVKIIDNLPDGLNYVPGSARLFDYDLSLNPIESSAKPFPELTWNRSLPVEVITWDVGDVEIGATHEIRFLAQVDTAYVQGVLPVLSGDSMTNNVLMEGYDDLFNNERHTDSSSATVSIRNPAFDKEIIAINGEFANTDPATATVGDKLTYELTLTGPGRDVGDIKIKDFLPAGLSNIQVVSDPAANIRFGPDTIYSGTFDPKVNFDLLASNGINWNVGLLGETDVMQIVFDAVVQDDINNVQDAKLFNNLGKAVSENTQGTAISFRDQVPVQYIVPALDIYKAAKLSTDANYIPGPGPLTAGGDSDIDYRLTIENSGDGPAFNIIVTDLIPIDLLAPGQSPTNISDGGFYVELVDPDYAGVIYWGIEEGDEPAYPAPPTQEDSNGSLQLSGAVNTKELTYTIKVRADVGASSEIVNTATIETYNTQVTAGNGRVYSDGPDGTLGGLTPPYVNPSDTFTVNVPDAIILKNSSMNSSDPNQPVGDLKVGDVFYYYITVISPGDRTLLPSPLSSDTDNDFDGTVYDAVIRDILDGSSLNSPHLVIEGVESVTAGTTDTTGNNLTWTMGDLPHGDSETLVLRVRVTNNDNSSIPPYLSFSPLTQEQRDTGTIDYNTRNGSNPASTVSSYDYNSSANSVTPGDTVVNDDIKQPRFTITKTANLSSVYGGQDVTYTINLKNEGDNDAYDLYIEDLLDSRLDYQPGTCTVTVLDSSGTTVATNNSPTVTYISGGGPGGTNVLRLSPVTVPQLQGPFDERTPAQSDNIIITFTATVEPVVGVGEIMRNTVYTRDDFSNPLNTYSSLPGAQPIIERQYLSVNAFFDVTVGELEFSKDETETTPPGAISNTNTDNRVTNGETVTYTLTYEVPPNTTIYDALLEDNLPDDVTFNGTTTGPVLNPPLANVTFVPPTPPAAGSDPLTWTLGDIQNNNVVVDPNDPIEVRAKTAIFQITYEVIVNNDVDRGTQLINDSSITFNSQSGGGNPTVYNDSTTLTVVNPNITTGTKNRVTIVNPALVPNGTTVDALNTNFVGGGDWIGYSIRLTNNGPNASDAYDVVIEDIIPPGMRGTQPEITGATLLGPGTDVTADLSITDWDSGTGVLEITFNGPLPVTDPTYTGLEIQYAARIDSGVGPDWQMENEASLRGYSTLPVTFTERRVFSEANGDTMPAFSPASQSVTTIDVNIDKSVTPTDATIGETVTYTVILSTIDLSATTSLDNPDITAYTVASATLQDTLPSNVEVTGISIAVEDVEGVSFVIPVIIGSSPYDNIIQNNLSPSSFLIVPDRNVIFTITARILDNNPPNVRGATFDNRANFHYSQTSGGPDVFLTDPHSDNSGNVTITEPRLSIDKGYLAIVPSTGGLPHTGSIITYQIRVTNNGDSEASDILIRDVIDEGMSYDDTADITITSPPDFTGLGSSVVNTYTAPNITFNFDNANGTDGLGLAPGESLVFTYDVRVDAGAGRFLDNTATLTEYYSLPDNTNPERRQYSDGSNTSELRMVAPNLVKTVVNNDAVPPETPSYNNNAELGQTLTYTVVFPDPAIQATLYDPQFSDLIPDGLTVTDAYYSVNGGGNTDFDVDKNVTGTLITDTTNPLPDLAPGDTVTATITVLVRTHFDNNLPIPVDTEFINQASLTYYDLSDTEPAREQQTTEFNQVKTTLIQSDGVSIVPERIKNIRPGDILVFPHIVTNTGNDPNGDVIDLTYTSTAGFIYDFFIDDGPSGPDGKFDINYDTILTDTDGDGVVDTGNLDPGDSLNILVLADVPGNTPEDTVEILVITATSSNNTSVSDSVTDQANLITDGPRLDVVKDIIVLGNTLPDGTPVPGSVITYEIKYINLGPGNATNVVIRDRVPDYTTYQTGTFYLDLDGGAYPAVPLTEGADADALELVSTPPVETLVVTVGDMDEGQEVKFKFNVLVK